MYNNFDIDKQELELLQGSSSSPNPGVQLSLKWLNVILDLNGILCVCEEKRFLPRNQQYNTVRGRHSSTVPSIVGPKAVFVRPSCLRFLENLSRFADISVWSSMKLSTVKEVCKHIFGDLCPPINILGQGSCDKIMRYDDDQVFVPMKVNGTSKDIFLKTLSKRVFPHFGGRYNSENTIVIDDSPVKHILNSRENIVLLEPWNYRGNGEVDSFLVDKLGPWLYDLHCNRQHGLIEFQKNFGIGRPMMSEDPLDMLYVEMMLAIEKSERMGFKYRS